MNGSGWGGGLRPQPPLSTPRLTAFVLKVLSLAQDQVGGSPEKLQETASWLLGMQQADGSFHDPCPVIHRGMQVRLCGHGWPGGAERLSQPLLFR